MNSRVITTKKFNFDRFSSGHVDRLPVVDIDLEAEKSANASVHGLREPHLLRFNLCAQRESSVCVCASRHAHVFDPATLSLPLCNQMMIKIIRSPRRLIMFTFAWLFRPQISCFGGWPLTTTRKLHEESSGQDYQLVLAETSVNQHI